MFKRLLLLNGVSIISVILFHSAGWGLVAVYFWSHRYLPPGVVMTSPSEAPSYYGLRFIEQLIVFCIPAFLFVSGVFVAVTAGRKATVGWGFVGSRTRDLGIPYLLWTTLVLLLAAVEGRRYGLGEYLVIFATGRANPAYYYVILLAQFYLLSPLLAPLAKQRPVALLVGAGLIQTAVQLLYYPALLNFSIGALDPLVDAIPKWLFLPRIFWFSAGIVIGFRLKEFTQFVQQWRRPSLIVALVLLPIGMIEWELMLHLSGQPWIDHRETLIDTLYSIAFIFAFLGFYQTPLPASDQLNSLGAKSFGIYISHSPVMEYAARALYHLAPALLGYQLFFQPFIITLGLGIPLLAMAVMQRSPLRGYYKYIFG